MQQPTPDQKAILEACASQPLETVLPLLATCPDPPNAKQMADEAANHGNAAVLEHLVRTAPASSLEPRGFLLFYSAAAHSRPCVEIMLSEQGGGGGCDINDRDDRVGNVLNWALGRCGCPDEIVAWFLERGARPCGGDDEEVPEQEYTLCRAAARGSVAIMRMLVAHGAEVDASRALHTAVAMGYVEKVRFLVEEAGADVNEPGWIRDPGTPLHRAAGKGYGGLVEYLLAHGARMDVRDGAGRTPFQVAFVNKRENVMAMLKGRGSPTELGIGMIEYTEGYRTRQFV